MAKKATSPTKAAKATKPKAGKAKKPTEPTICDVIRARLRARPSVTTIAARSGVSDSQLSKFLKGLHVRSDTLDKIATALELRVVAIEDVEPAAEPDGPADSAD